MRRAADSGRHPAQPVRSMSGDGCKQAARQLGRPQALPLSRTSLHQCTAITSRPPVGAGSTLQSTGAIAAGGQAQYLDKLQVERERGITVKVRSCSRCHGTNLPGCVGHGASKAQALRRGRGP